MQPSNTISIDTLFEKYGEQLCLSWIAGKHGNNRLITPERRVIEQSPATPVIMMPETTDSPDLHVYKSLTGQMNPVRPQQIPLLGLIELQYLQGQSEPLLHDALTRLIKDEPACIIIADDELPPAFLTMKCNEHDIPLFTSSLPGQKLLDLIKHHLINMLSESIVMNGVFMEVMDAGILITGASGIGKSELALELITRGHRLVADDATKFSRHSPDIITGICPEILKDFLEVRGLGIINVRHIYGDNSIKDKKVLNLVVRLEPMERPQLLSLDRLDGSYDFQNILDVKITEIILPVAPGRNLAILLECAVRNHMLRKKGYNAPEEFINKQLHFIKKQSD